MGRSRASIDLAAEAPRFRHPGCTVDINLVVQFVSGLFIVAILFGRSSRRRQAFLAAWTLRWTKGIQKK